MKIHYRAIVERVVDVSNDTWEELKEDYDNNEHLFALAEAGNDYYENGGYSAEFLITHIED